MCGRAEAIAQWLEADEACMVHAEEQARALTLTLPLALLLPLPLPLTLTLTLPLPCRPTSAATTVGPPCTAP